MSQQHFRDDRRGTATFPPGSLTVLHYVVVRRLQPSRQPQLPQVPLHVNNIYEFAIRTQSSGQRQSAHQSTLPSSYEYKSFNEIVKGPYEVTLRNCAGLDYASQPDYEHRQKLLSIPFDKHKTCEYVLPADGHSAPVLAVLDSTRTRLNQMLRDHSGRPDSEIARGTIKVVKFRATIGDRALLHPSIHDPAQLTG